jgi:thiamine-monophosphate kinase
VAERWVLDGGEDHGLLATFPSGTPLPEPFRAVGRVVEGTGVSVDGVPAPARSGWDHFAG